MTASKLRAAIIVFCIGFALGLGVFAASRLYVRSLLTNDALAAAAELANRLANREPIDANGSLRSIVRYTYFDDKKTVLETATLGAPARTAGEPDAAEIARRIDFTGGRKTVVTHAPLLSSLLGLSEPVVEAVAVPVNDGRTVGVVYAEIDQDEALRALTQAFNASNITTVALAALALVVVAFAVSRRRGLSAARKALDDRGLTRDPLTGLLSRQSFKEMLADAVQQGAAADRQVGLLVIDLNHFRSVNDIWGHGVGDEVLKVAADRLRAFAARPGTLSRITGNHFALIVEGEATHALRQLAEKIRDSLGAPYQVGESSIALDVSVGAALFPVNAEDADTLFRAADSALSKANTRGRGMLAFFDTEMGRRMRDRATLERDLRLALQRNEFVVFYQAQVEIATRRLRGHEALVRWERPGHGILSPRDFLPVAEETGIIRQLGEFVLLRACKDAASWLHGGTVSVNFSAAQFRAHDLDQTIARALAETGLPAERLEIEVPESLFLDDEPEAIETLHRIKALGVRVAMDDFGAGYSSLASIAHFPFDKIKIDRSFVSQLTQDADVAAIVASIVGLGRSLSVDVTAEGVETTDQVTMLQAAGCSIAQGFLFGVPKRDAVMADAALRTPPKAEEDSAAAAGAV